MAELSNETRFDGFVAARNNETIIRWQKVQIFFLINSVLLGTTIGATLDARFKIVICVFGFIVTVIWWLMQWEAQNAIDYWNFEAARLEPRNEENKIHGFAFTRPREGFRFKFISTHYLILFLIDFFILGWITLFIYYLFFQKNQPVKGITFRAFIYLA